MVNGEAIGAAVVAWAKREASVRALVLIGSRVRGATAGEAGPDEFSDWDFQVVSTRPELFATRAWMHGLGLGEPLAYVARTGRLGTATKVSVVLPGGELDLVVLPARRLGLAKLLVNLGLAIRFGGLRHALGGMAVVLRGGYRIEKGEREWAGFFRRVASDFSLPRLNDDEVRAQAEGFVCDYVSARQKVNRGEFLAAQRWLHHQLAEVNFQLLHELRQRRGQPTFPDARRIERLGEGPRVEVRALPERESLRTALDKSAATLRELMAALVGDTWRWPDV